ncbi:MAG: TonB-dependent receptor [Bacteroidota bacterium]
MRGLYLLMLLCLLSFVRGHGQTLPDEHNTDRITLQAALTLLEDLHKVRFSYNPQHIPPGEITLPIKTLALDKALARLSATYQVYFEKIDARYYGVRMELAKMTICGLLCSSTNKAPLEGANILNTSNLRGTTTDAKGYFVSQGNSTKDSIVISVLGYESRTILVDQWVKTTCDTLFLKPTNYALDEVVVQEYLGVGMLQRNGGGIIIAPKNLNLLSGLAEPDVLQNLQLLPGVESPGETASGLYVRGGSPDQNLVLWDGIKMYNTNHFFGMVSAFNPYIVESVTLHRSGAHPKYGDRISGVIDIQTEEDIPKKVQGQVGLNTLHFDANLKVPLSKKVGFLLSGRRSFTDIFRSPTLHTFSQKVFQNTSLDEPIGNFDPNLAEADSFFSYYDWSAKALVVPSNSDKLNFSVLTTENALGYFLRPLGTEEVSGNDLDLLNIGGSTRWSRVWSPHFTSEVTAYLSRYRLTDQGENPFLDQSLYFQKANTITEIGLSTHVVWSPNKVHSYSGGYQFFNNKVSYNLRYNNFITSDETRGRTHSVYAHYHYDKVNRWNLGLGIRCNHYSPINIWVAEPRLQIAHQLLAPLRLKASAEIRNQAVRQIVTFFTPDFGLENQVWALANDEGIPLLRSEQFSTGLLWASNNLWHIDIETYYKRIKGFTSATRGFELMNDALSEGQGYIKGLDVLIKKTMGNYTTWLGYTWAKNQFFFPDLNNGVRFPGNNDIRHSFSWSHFYRWKKWEFSMGWKYRSGIPYTQALGLNTTNNTTTVVYDVPNAKNLPAYHRLDCSVRYTFKWSKKAPSNNAKMGLSILNLYNRRTVLNRSYDLLGNTDENTEDTDIALGTVDEFSLGITPTMFIRVSF